MIDVASDIKHDGGYELSNHLIKRLKKHYPSNTRADIRRLLENNFNREIREIWRVSEDKLRNEFNG